MGSVFGALRYNYLQELPNTVWRGIFKAAEEQQESIKHPDTVKEVRSKTCMRSEC